MKTLVYKTQYNYIFSSKMNKAQIQAVFKFYDKNNDQEITPQEIKTAMAKCMGSEEKAEQEKNVSRSDLNLYVQNRQS